MTDNKTDDDKPAASVASDTPQAASVGEVLENKPFTKPVGKLTKKQADFVRIYKETGNATEAAQLAYNVTSRAVAGSIGTENLHKPAIMSRLHDFNDLIEDTISGTIRDWGTSDNTRKREIAVNTATWAHDKVHGKARQQLDVNTTKVEIILDLSGD